MTKEIEILSEEPNATVVCIPGRQFPGIVVQGDTLKSWHELASEVLRAIEKKELNEAEDSARYLREKIGSHLGTYERTLEHHGRPFPYSRHVD
jgi:hypothetical protein